LTRLVGPLRAEVVERHRTVTRPYPGAAGFVLAQCRVCDGARWTVRVKGRPYRCAVVAGVVGVR
jgi:hypothetical protein